MFRVAEVNNNYSLAVGDISLLTIHCNKVAHTTMYIALGLGSNKTFSGLSCVQILAGAVSALSAILSDIQISSVYRTKAMYVTDQEDFYNMALVGFAGDDISACDLLSQIHKIEAKFGRDRSKEIRFGSRSLDIDIEFFGTERISTSDLEIPHPRLKERAFVLTPLLEILENSADNSSREFFCFSKDGLALALAALGEQGVQKALSAEELSLIVKKQRCDYGTSS